MKADVNWHAGRNARLDNLPLGAVPSASFRDGWETTDAVLASAKRDVQPPMREIGEVVRDIVNALPMPSFVRVFAEGELQDAAIEWSAARAVVLQNPVGNSAGYNRLANAEARLQTAVKRLQEIPAGDVDPKGEHEFDARYGNDQPMPTDPKPGLASFVEASTVTAKSFGRTLARTAVRALGSSTYAGRPNSKPTA